MAEKQLNITENTGKDGKVYLNVDFRKDLLPETNDFVIVEKIFPDGRKYDKQGQFGAYSFYGVNMRYQGQTVGVFMNQKLYDQWLAAPMGNLKVSTKIVKGKKGYIQVFDVEQA